MQRDEVLFANEAFYIAFAGRDLAMMEAVWATDVPVACVHPGAVPLISRRSVMASWQAILEGSEAPAIRHSDAEVFLYGDFAFVVCYERVGPNVLVATNVFQRQGGAWKMIHHQAGPTAARPSTADVGPAGQVH